MAVSTLDYVNSVIQSNVKAPVVGPEGDVPEEDTSRMALESAMKSLQQRYENPNWFNVAAGFFKPQLGGFAASLGSASQALGENLEKQRENELPIAAMRAQLGSANKQIANKRAAYTMFQDATKKGFENMPTEDLLALQSNMVKMGHKELADTVGSYVTGTQTAETTERNAIALKYQMLKDGRANETIGTAEYDIGMADIKRREAVLNAKNAPRAKKVDASGKDAETTDTTDAVAKAAAAIAASKTSAAEAPAAAAVAAPAAAAKVVAAAPAAPAVDIQGLRAANEAAAAQPKELFVLKGGARVDEEGLALSKLGIPIISQYRTKEDQEKLKQDGGYQVGNKWFTKAGRPIAEDSLHFTGDAIDVGNITAAQKELLIKNGWKQTGGPNDTNHWSRPRTAPAAAAAAAAAPVPAAAPAVDEEEKRAKARATLRQVPVTLGLVLPTLPRGATANDVTRFNAEKDRILAQAADQEKVPMAQLQNYQSIQNAAPAIKSVFSSLVNEDPKKSLGILTNPALTNDVHEVLNQVRKAGVAAAMADQGIGISFNPGVGLNLNIPVRSGLKAGLTQPQMLLQDTILKNAANAVYWSLRAQGTDLAKLQPDEAKAILFGSLFQDATPLGLKHTIELAQAHINHGLRMGEDGSHLYKESRSKESLTPASDAFNSSHPLMDANRSIYAKELEKINAKYGQIMQQGVKP